MTERDTLKGTGPVQCTLLASDRSPNLAYDLRHRGGADELRLAAVQSPNVSGGSEIAQRIITVTLDDDLDGGPADQTVRFAVGGAAYEIDLSKKNAAAFREQLAPFIEHAREADRARPRRPARTTASRQRSSDIRAWAHDHGIAVSGRGRIPASVVAQYEAATRDVDTQQLTLEPW